MTVHNDVRVTFRVDKDLKETAEKLFERLGMNMSTALNVFLHKAVDEEAIPFLINVKKNVFGSGYAPDDVTGAFKTAVSHEIAENEQRGTPVARYDRISKQAYLEYADGTRESINE